MDFPATVQTGIKTIMIEEFIKAYGRQRPLEAIASLIPSPNTTYEQYDHSAFSRALLNFADSLVYGNPTEAWLAGSYLLQNPFPLSAELRTQLAKDCSALHHLFSTEEGIATSSSKWNSLKKKKKITIKFPFGSQRTFGFPYLPLSFEGTPAVQTVQKGTTALLFMEPWRTDWKKLLDPLKGKRALFLFLDGKHLDHCLHFAAIAKSLADPAHGFYLLAYDPKVQFAQQKNLCGPYASYLAPTREPFASNWEALQRALETEPLYNLAQNLYDRHCLARYGPFRRFAAQGRVDSRQWNDPIKSLVSTPLRLEPHARSPRKVNPSAKLKLVHVVPQIVKEGHAPTRLLTTLLNAHNRKRFDVSVYSTERLLFRPSEYPYDPFSSDPSTERAPALIAGWRQSGIQVTIGPTDTDFRGSAAQLNQFLTKNKIDVAIFHGPDAINLIAASETDVPLRALFEHGTPANQPLFDLVIASSEEARDHCISALHDTPCLVEAHPFVIDVRDGWDATPPTKAELGVPEGAQILTTISNHLESRVTGEMQHAIGQILLANPRAHYLPMGPMNDPDGFKERFTAWRVADRVLPLGHQRFPSQLARGMDLYLNEFPFGSGLALLDAMAAGVPLVTMYSQEGPPQARYGGVYFGIEQSITCGSAAKYVQLANSLLKDDKKRQLWSEIACSRYENRTDPDHYTGSIEKAIERALSSPLTATPCASQ